MPVEKMVNSWFSCYRDLQPNEDPRLNSLVIDFSDAQITNTNAVENAINAVMNITKNHPPPYKVLMSGGVDSQAVAYAWLLSGKPFSAIHFSYGSNLDDTQSCVAFCALRNIDLEIHHFDPLPFITSDRLVEAAVEFDCSSPQILSHIEMMRELPDATYVMSGNFIQPDICGLNWTILGLQRYADKYRKDFIPFFFLSDANIAYSFYEVDRRIKYEHFQKTGERSDYFNKCECYTQLGFPVVPQFKKLTGFEVIKEQFDDTKVPFMTKLTWSNMPSKRPFDFLYRYSLYNSIGLYSEQTRLIHPPSINT